MLYITFLILSFFCLSIALFLLLIRPLTVPLSFLLPYLIHSLIHAFIPQSVLLPIRSLFQSEFSTEGDLVLLLSVSTILSFPQGRPVAAYVFFLVLQLLYPSMRLPFNNSFQNTVPSQDVANPVSLPPVQSDSFGTRPKKMRISQILFIRF